MTIYPLIRHVLTGLLVLLVTLTGIPPVAIADPLPPSDSTLSALVGTPPADEQSPNSPAVDAALDSAKPEQPTEPSKTYFLSLASENARRRVNLDPPATRLSITSESGDTAVQCGDGGKTYSCVPGSSLKIQHDADDPISYIWAQNSSANRVRLRIDVYETISLLDTLQ
ncbi:MAG: hypothetical protein ACFE0J_14435 [Elainellaceae cyanobacterium]